MNANSLLLRCREGDTEALEAFARRYQPVIERLARATLDDNKSASRADDVRRVTQETLLAAVSAGNVFRDDTELDLWILALALRFSRRQLRRRTGPKDRSPGSDGPKTTRGALRQLEETLRLPLLLHYSIGLSLPDIAQVLRISQASVEARMAQGREQMRVLLEEA